MNLSKLKKLIISIFIILLFITSEFMGVLTLKGIMDIEDVSAASIIVTKSGVGHYNSIQMAIGNANLGDTIYVWAGTYNENVIINKKVTLIGNGSVNTNINGSGIGDVVRITANLVNISGFKITNSGKGGVPDPDAGIKLEDVQNVTIKNNNCSNNYVGICVFRSKSCSFINNTCNLNDLIGIFMDNSDSNVIMNNICNSSLSHCGIQLEHCDNNIIINNTCGKNYHSGIYLWLSNQNKIINNSCNYNYKGTSIWLHFSNSNFIENNTCYSNSLGNIAIMYSSSNYIAHNFCNNPKLKNGIVMGWSKTNVITNNTMINCNLIIDGKKLEEWNTHMIDNSNLVNGKPVLYLKNRNGGLVPSDVAQVFLANCTNITISNLNISNSILAIILGFSYFNSIINNTLNNNFGSIYLIYSNNNLISNNSCNSNDRIGIFITYSDKNIIENNHCSYNKVIGFFDYMSSGRGVYLAASNYNTIFNNTFNFNEVRGIHIEDSLNNMIHFNNICENKQYGIYINNTAMSNTIVNNLIANNKEIGIYINNSNNNRVFYNNIINNSIQAEESGNSNNNHWDNGNGEGNYWSDYTGLDNGAYGRISGDGVGDTEIPHLELDYFPLVNKSGWLYPGIPILFDIEFDSDGFDSNGNYTVTWFPARGATGYILERDTSDQFFTPSIIYNGSDRSYLINYKANDTYYYRVKGYNKEYESAWSNVVNVTVDLPPDIPSNLTVSTFPEGNALNITWKPNQIDTLEYDLYYKKKSKTLWIRAADISHPKHTFNHTKLQDNQEYEYKILARDGRNQESNYSEIVSGIPQDSIAPEPPKGLRIASTTYNSIELTWNPNSEDDLEGYRIYKSIIPNPFSWGEPIVNFPKYNDEFIDLDVGEITTYYYVITAVDEVPNESNYSLIISGTTKLAPHKPEINNSLQDFTMLEDTIDNTSIKLQDWFRDINTDKLTYLCSGNVFIDIIINE